LDIELGLAANSFSLLVVGLTTRLSTFVPFDQATAIVSEFLGWSPAKQSIEDAVLEVGKYTGKWFEQAGPPSGDGDVLVVQFDGKCVPTATDTELSKRRGKRRENRYSDSARHRGREERHRRGKRKRRKRGDKSKNGKEVTLVVMYTLKWESDAKGEPFLKGPINKWVYASFGSKRHVFEVARREAIKRGFGPDSDKLLQVVTDGDNSLADLIADYFPGAMHTIDIMHALEYLWKAGSCLHKEGSKELQAWYEKNKRLLYDGEVTQLVKNLEHTLEGLPRRGPGTKSRRDRLSKTINYLKKRVELMDYRLYQDLDLEIASGAVEGAVRHVVAKRFDYGSMRWIRERGEPLLQLRCIQINGDWEMFLRYVRRSVAEQAKRDLKTPSLRCSQPQPLPTIAKAS
jgi:hypothetical protein